MKKGKFKIKISKHAKIQMEIRGISERLVEQTINKPHQVIESKGRRRKIAQRRIFDNKKSKEYLIRVFFEETQTEKVIITVYQTSKIEKYWRENGY